MMIFVVHTIQNDGKWFHDPDAAERYAQQFGHDVQILTFDTNEGMLLDEWRVETA